MADNDETRAQGALEGAKPHPEAAPYRVGGFMVYAGLLGRVAQENMVADLRAVVRAAPAFAPQTRFGKAMSVRMTSAGKCGWYSDRRGYRYIAAHPSGTAWPSIPASVLRVWGAVSGTDCQPDCCLINFYGEGARMGLHQDRDEADFNFPVVSISLGDDGLFRMGGVARGDPTRSLWLRSGDVVVMGGAARLAFHGIDRIRFASSSLLEKGGRMNLTLRVVDRA